MNKSSSSVSALFDSNYNSIVALGKVIEFNPSWNNGTGYLNGSVEGPDAVHLGPEEVAYCITTNNRKIIFVGTIYGPVCIFQRYTDGEGGVIVWNANRDTERFMDMDHTALNPETFHNIFEKSHQVCFVPGMEVTCQFGNSSDTFGYAANIPCIVLASQKRICGTTYLVSKVDDPDYLGDAILSNGYHRGTLYCTNARKVGERGGGTREAAITSLGYSA